MKAVIQRVKSAVLSVDGKEISAISEGLCVYFGVIEGDTETNAAYFAKKIANMRIFEDECGKMNFSALDKGFEILLISQFTLAGNCSHGNRPDFTAAEKPDKAKATYEKFGKLLEGYGLSVKYGVFGADMTIMQKNDGPVTIVL